MSCAYTISVYTENSPGVLHRITAMFTRRKINVESLTVSETEQHGISRFTIMANLDEDLVDKLVKQIARVIEVRDVFASLNSQLIFKEIAFFRVAVNSPDKRTEVEELAHRYGASMVYVSQRSLVLEKTGAEDVINSLYLLLEPFGITEFVRSGRIAIRKDV